jgi:hypothetical protein
MGCDKGPADVPAEVPEILQVQVPEDHEGRQAQQDIFLDQQHHEEDKIDQVKKDEAEQVKNDFPVKAADKHLVAPPFTL